MYYQSGNSASPTANPSVIGGLQMTPSVALRALESQLVTFITLTSSSTGTANPFFAHFEGPINPPRPGIRRPMGDPVFNAVSVYASKILAQRGLLASQAHNHGVINLTDQLTREMFAFEHSLALDLARHRPDMELSEREIRAQAVLAVAAFWCDRKELLDMGMTGSHFLLGTRPSDDIGAALYDYALAAVSRAF